MGVELEAINDNGEISLSLDKPAMTLDAWATASANDSSNRSKIGSRRSVHRWSVSGYGSLRDDLIGFRTSTHYAALVKLSNGTIQVWSNSGSLWDDFEIGVFRRSTSVTGYQDDPTKFAGGYCELRAANERFIYNSNWPNVSDIATFRTLDLLGSFASRAGNTERSSFSGRSRSGGVDWIVPMGLTATFVEMDYNESVYLRVRWRWERYASLMRINRTTSSNVDVRMVWTQFWRSSRGTAYGFGIRRWDIPGYDGSHKTSWRHTPEVMVFRTFGTY